ncbi:MAG: tRNA glutamyl-Q(34) synthetase GluQRS [Rhodospirillales bacterium]|nr:tRNA glutamyl-Q(34) synthetase GluQRS [Rhodospirillales bacterium]
MTGGRVTRFAPSPNGFLHLGHAYSALLNWDLAQTSGGMFLLRVEDIDTGRSRPEFEAAISEDLTWLGLHWETPVRRQSEHFDDYRDALSRLTEMDVLYPCFCTRKDILAEVALSDAAPHGPLGTIYPGICRSLTPEQREERIGSGRSYALRLDVGKALAVAATQQQHPLTWRETSGVQPEDIRCDLTDLGDVVLARKDVPTSYHLAVTLDDHLQGITLVARGQDLRPATHIHRLLQAVLDLDTPDYFHHRLIEGPEGDKLSKRKGAPALRSLRDSGVSPGEIRRMVGLAEAP